MEIIKHCPSCDALLERVKDQLFCRNPHCGDQQLKRVQNYASKMKIKGLGEKTIERLDIRSIPEVYEITQETAAAVIGEKLAEKLMMEIDKSKQADLAVFLSACSIPLIGITAGKKVANVVDNPYEITTTKCKEAGLGDKATQSLVSWVDSEYKEVLVALPVNFIKPDTTVEVTNGYNIKACITGKVPGFTKSTLAEKLAVKGVKVVNSVTKDLDYLVCEDRKGSSKELKATEYNIKIVTLSELFKEIN